MEVSRRGRSYVTCQFHVLYNRILNLQLDRNTNSPPIAHCRFSNVVLGKGKSKKEKWQCSQNLDLNPTCETLNSVSPRFAEILLAHVHHQIFHKRSSFISQRFFIVESCNFCRVDEQFVHAEVENMKILAKRAHPYRCTRQILSSLLVQCYLVLINLLLNTTFAL